MNWKRVNQGEIKESLIDYVEKLIEVESEKGMTLKVCIGSDSQKRGPGYNYVTAIVIERKECIGTDRFGKKEFLGRGAMVISGSMYEKFIPSLNERMLKEVQSTVTVAYELLPLLDLYDIKLELHADINQSEKHGSNVALKSAMGYMSGIPCDIKVKPSAYAASTVADKLCQ
mgnify:CR=1 FL=1